MNENWKSYHGIALFAIVIITFLAVFWIPPDNILWVWIIMLGALSLFSMVASHGINGRFLLGWLINEQYRMSLSRLQMFLWTIVILSAFFAAVLANVNAEHYENAVNIAIPREIWIAMGISVTSLIGSPLILSQKKKKKTNKEVLKKTRVSLHLMKNSDKVNASVLESASGQLQQNKKPEDAHLYDLIAGEEVGNFNVIDLTRLQNLFFTFILIGTYAINLGSLLVAKANNISNEAITEFPPIDESFVALLAISHAGYLITKAVDKQPDAQQ
ncbi:MAG: hypothetical protein GY775_04725 [Candidatus Scalindua sp.]|nr:hypothetical protein [Candidatus Scalindua sp.]